MGAAVDSSDEVYVTRRTRSAEITFLMTGGPDLTFNGGEDDAFIARLLDQYVGLFLSIIAWYDFH